MKLKDYFQDRKDFQLSENQKFALYEKIISQQKKRSFLHTFKIKYFAYGLITLVLLFGIYGVYFDGDFDSLVVQAPVNQVTADYIAKIVEFDGNFFVQHGTRLYKTSKISNGDNIILKKDSELIFEIDSGTKAKITGPARFSLSQNENGYQLLISEGDFVQLESMEEYSAPMDIAMGDFKVSSENNINLLITKTDNEYKLSNQGGNIKVTRNNSTTQVKAKELVAINENDITLIQNVEQFQTAFVEQKINQTFEIKDLQPEDVTDSLIKELSTGTVKVENKELATELGIIDSKKIPTEDQTKILYTTLDSSSLMWIFENMWELKTLGDEKNYKSQKNQIDTKIQSIYTAFNLKNEKLGTKENLEALIKNLENGYHIPDAHIEKLKTIINWISYFETMKPYELSTNTENSENDSETVETKKIGTEEVELMWADFEKNLPSNLILK